MTKSEREMRRVRGRRISMILQDPQTSLNPVFTVGNQIVEALRSPPRGRARAACGSGPRTRCAACAWPRPPSGCATTRTRSAADEAARGRAPSRSPCEPRLLIADEPTTALDVDHPAPVPDAAQGDPGAHAASAMLFITHDFGIVARMCDRVAVMYAGRIVESGPDARDVPRRRAIRTPQALMASVPRMEARTERLPSIEGQPPSLHACRRAAGSRRAAATPRTAAAPSTRRRSRSGRRTRRRAGGRSPRDRRRRRCSRSRTSPKHFPVTQGSALRADHRAREGGRRDQLHDRPRGDARPGRRVGLRQDHDGAAASCGSSGRPAGRVLLDGRDVARARRRRRCSDYRAQRAGGVPGPVVLAQPAHARAATPSPRRWSCEPARRRRATARPRGRGARAGRAARRTPAQRYPHEFSRRPAPAHRARQRARLAARS